MVDKVVDASAIAAILFDELDSEVVSAVLAGAKLFAPPLLWFELTSVCLKKCRARPDERAGLYAAFARRSRLGVTETAVDPGEVVRLAVATGLSGYDASYLWLARQRGLELVTLDQKLARVAAEEPT